MYKHNEGLRHWLGLLQLMGSLCPSAFAIHRQIQAVTGDLPTRFVYE